MTKKELYKYSGVVKHIADGDTCIITLSLGFKVYKDVDVRLARINAPELSSKDTAIAKKAMESKDFLTVSILDCQVLVSSTKLDKYGRSIAEVWKDGININDLMVEKGYAISQKY